MMHQNDVKELDVPLGMSLDKLQALLIVKSGRMWGGSQKIQ